MKEVILSGDMRGSNFVNVNLVYQGGDVDLSGSKIKGCEFEVRGDAAIGVNFMKDMFNGGLKCAVMKTFLSDDEYEKVKEALNWEGKDGN